MCAHVKNTIVSQSTPTNKQTNKNNTFKSVWRQFIFFKLFTPLNISHLFHDIFTKSSKPILLRNTYPITTTCVCVWSLWWHLTSNPLAACLFTANFVSLCIFLIHFLILCGRFLPWTTFMIHLNNLTWKIFLSKKIIKQKSWKGK